MKKFICINGNTDTSREGDNMITAVNGYYDGYNIVVKDNIALKKGQNVIVTFEVDDNSNKPEPIGYYEDGKPYYRKAGMFKGKGWMADDFDAPLDEFKEYMA